VALSSFKPLEAATFTIRELNATPRTLIAAGTALITYAMEMDNSENAEDSYVKLYHKASPTVSTDDPFGIFRVGPGKVRSELFSTNNLGLEHTDPTPLGVALACVTEPGTGGSVSPTNPVKVTVKTN